MDLKFQKLLYNKTLQQLEENKKYPSLRQIFKEQAAMIKKEMDDYKRSKKGTKTSKKKFKKNS